MSLIKFVKRAAFPALVGYGVFAVFSLNAAKGQSEKVMPLPLVLEKVQSLGELHTTRFSYNNVFQYETAQEPALWVSYIPAGASLVNSATTNRAVLSAHGTIEAGIDLTKAKAAYEAGKLVVTLPQPRLYKPHVETTVHEWKPGWFWSDANLGLKAQRDAGMRMRQASLDQGILEQAKQSAETRVKALFGSAVSAVEVRFENRSGA